MKANHNLGLSIKAAQQLLLAEAKQKNESKSQPIDKFSLLAAVVASRS